MPPTTPRHVLVPGLLLLSLAACGDGGDGGPPTAGELDLLETLTLTPEALPASPTNAHADSADAARLGQRLFFDRRLSANGTVACVDCHRPELGFSDDRQFSLGTEGQEGTRHAMPIVTAAMQPFLLWDGRADSVWRQPLLAIENELEMDASRTEVAHFVAANHREEYERAFGPLPDLEGVPARAFPGDEAWASLDDAQRDAVQRVFVNVGKALEAYERQLLCVDTRFDRWMRGELELTEAEIDGAARFLRAGCTNCHDGPALSDGRFHNLGLATIATFDLGREAALAELFDDPLNGAGAYSDDPIAGAARLREAEAETRVRGAFRTASLRGVGQRARFGHLGEHRDLEAFIEDVYRDRGGRGGPGDGAGPPGADGGILGAPDPLLDEVNLGRGDEQAIVTFLRTLDCPDLDPALLRP